MRQIIRSVDLALRAVVILCMAGIMLAVGLQVVARATIGAYSWPEELSVILMLWGLLLGGGYVLAERGHVGIVFVVERLGPRTHAWINIAMHLLLIGFCVATIWGAIDKVQTIARLRTGALGISRAWPNLSIPVACCFYIIVSLRLIAEDLLQARDAQ